MACEHCAKCTDDDCAIWSLDVESPKQIGEVLAHASAAYQAYLFDTYGEHGEPSFPDAAWDKIAAVLNDAAVKCHKIAFEHGF